MIKFILLREMVIFRKEFTINLIVKGKKKPSIYMFPGAHISIHYLEIVVIEFEILQCMEKCHLEII